jgi:hypothetical protein
MEIKMYTNRFFSFLVIVALAAVVALTIQEAVATKAVTFVPQVRDTEHQQRIRAAEVARWTAMGQYYENLEAAKLQRSRNADAARWTGQADYYQRFEEAQKIQRGRAADTARWTAMGQYHRGLVAASTLSRAQAADAARWKAMAEYYTQIGSAVP